MHDQKLTEELEFLRSSPEYFAFMYVHIKKPERNNQADQLFRRGMVGAATRIVMEQSFPILNRYKKRIVDGHMKATILDNYWKQFEKESIDHPYLLPPSTGRTAWRNKAGELASVNIQDIDCRKDGTIWVSTEWLGPGSGFFLVDIE